MKKPDTDASRLKKPGASVKSVDNSKKIEEVIKYDNPEEISSDLFKETIKISYGSNDFNVIKEKYAENDSAITNITHSKHI